jgi:hypothetical protein
MYHDDFCHQGRDTEIAPTFLRLLKPTCTGMTIHWKALGKHFLTVSLYFRFNQFPGENAFSVFSSKNLSFNELMQLYMMSERFLGVTLKLNPLVHGPVLQIMLFFTCSMGAVVFDYLLDARHQHDFSPW